MEVSVVYRNYSALELPEISTAYPPEGVPVWLDTMTANHDVITSLLVQNKNWIWYIYQPAFRGQFRYRLYYGIIYCKRSHTLGLASDDRFNEILTMIKNGMNYDEILSCVGAVEQCSR